MGEDTRKTVKLGAFVVVGTVLLIVALYLIGDRQNMFSDNLKINAKFRNVSGLMQGNTVRYGGIDVGAVKDVYIANDSEVTVEMIIDKKVEKFLGTGVIATIGTDGLMGNRIINLISTGEKLSPLKDGVTINAINPLETDELMRDFGSTGRNIKDITENLTAITGKLRQNNQLWELLGDTTLTRNVRASLNSMKMISSNAVRVSEDLQNFSASLNKPGNLASVITDSVAGKQVSHIINNLNVLSDSLNKINKNVASITEKINSGNGAAAMLLNDSTFAKDITASIDYIKGSALKLEENMEALQHSFLLRKYFKSKHRQKPITLNKENK